MSASTAWKITAPVTLALLLSACSTAEVVTLAGSANPQAALDTLSQSRIEGYRKNPVQLVNDIERLRRDYNRLLGLLRGEVDKSWGGDEVVTAEEKQYVKYTQNYLSRAIVQFEQGLVTVETVDQQAPLTSLKSAIVTTLLTPDDPRAVDLYTASRVRLSGRPYLAGLVIDQEGKAVETPWRAERFADFLLKNRLQRRTAAKAGKTVHFIKLRMVNDYQNQQATRYRDPVERYAKQYGISKTLVYAIIKTESAFNPFAVSAAPAYGLMQLVPATGGRDAYSHVKGYDHTPSKEYLFDAQNNIELGTAYLSLLDRRYLEAIRDPLSREYCAIAAYNGGAGSVFNLFASDRRQAAETINRLPPAEVYQRLRDRHPREETRRYLVKVLDARREFVRL